MKEVEKDYNKKPWIKMPLSELKTPIAGRLCMGPRWWAVTEDGCVLFYKAYYSPQCNQSKQMVERIRPDLNPVYVEVAFVPHDCSDYA